MFIGFASDNTAGVHPRIMQAILEANAGYCRPYGFDEWSEAALAQFHRLFGHDVQVFFRAERNRRQCHESACHAQTVAGCRLFSCGAYQYR